jgi:hypothetical protein
MRQFLTGMLAVLVAVAVVLGGAPPASANQEIA